MNTALYICINVRILNTIHNMQAMYGRKLWVSVLTWAGQIASHSLQAMQRSSPEGYLVSLQSTLCLGLFYLHSSTLLHNDNLDFCPSKSLQLQTNFVRRWLNVLRTSKYYTTPYFATKASVAFTCWIVVNMTNNLNFYIKCVLRIS